jgi:hypothetical protein
MRCLISTIIASCAARSKRAAPDKNAKGGAAWPFFVARAGLALRRKTDLTFACNALGMGTMTFRKAMAGLLLALGAGPPNRPLPRAAPAPALSPAWAFEHSDVAPDPAWRFGRLPNGMRYILRHSDPQGRGGGAHAD